jgi:hypothetical protein
MRIAITREISKEVADFIVDQWDEHTGFVHASAFEMLRQYTTPKKPPPAPHAVSAQSMPNPSPKLPVNRDAESSERSARALADRSVSPVDTDAQSSNQSAAATDALPPSPNPSSTIESAPEEQPTPEELCEKFSDEDTEMEIVLSRVFSGPDLEKALGRKPRLGLTSDKPYDCPIDPATGCLKQRPEPPEPKPRGPT